MTKAKLGRSKIVEFGMILEALAARWHKKHLLGSFATFKALREKFLPLFH